MDVKLPISDIIAGTSYVELAINPKSIINVRNTKDNDCAVWFVLIVF